MVGDLSTLLWVSVPLLVAGGLYLALRMVAAAVAGATPAPEKPIVMAGEPVPIWARPLVASLISVLILVASLTSFHHIGAMYGPTRDPELIASCHRYREQQKAAEVVGNAGSALDIWKRVKASGACPAPETIWLGRAAANAVQVAALKPGLSYSERVALLDHIEEIDYAPWQALASLGDLRRAEAQRISRESESNEVAARVLYGKAARVYRLALSDISDEQQNPQAPSLADIRGVFTKTQEMMLLAADHVPAPAPRSGVAGGILTRSYRGFTPASTVVPVEYAYNSTEFTQKGQLAAQEVAQALERLGAEVGEIKLVGHTDPKGSNEFNDKLSLERANALKNFLQKAGFKGRIITEGKGKRDKPQINDEALYSTADLHQLMRRVELVR